MYPGRPFIAVMVVPTGIGARVGGHSGYATAAARALAVDHFGGRVARHYFIETL